ncbi:branched-chain amino acid transport system substrate-binding protein [uncultured Gammaproteobacteria bacterium]
MKAIMGLLGVALAALAVGPVRAETAPVTVGAIEILTGPNARYGVSIKTGLELALDEINAAGGVLGHPLTLIVEDSAGNKEQAINAARKLIARDKVAAIIGPTLSNEMFAVGPVANERKIPIIGTSTTAKGITDIGPYVFRTSLPESDVIPVTLKTAQAKFGIKRVAVMYGNDDAFTKSGYDVFKETLDKMGIEIATIETFGGKDSDFSAQLTKIKGLNVEAVVVSALVEAASGILLQARQLGIPDQIFFIGGNGLNSAKLGEIAGKSADGTLVGSPWFIGKQDPMNQKFVEAFQKKSGGLPDQFAAQAYDTLHILAEALTRAGGTDSDKLRDALLETKHTGVMGPFRFTDHRDPGSNDGVVVLLMKDGKFGALQ